MSDYGRPPSRWVLVLLVVGAALLSIGAQCVIGGSERSWAFVNLALVILLGIFWTFWRSRR